MQRLSNNRYPKFSDEECITAYLYGVLEGRLTRRAIYDFTKDYLLEWFPRLPSYQAFCRRLNLLTPVFQALTETWMEKLAESSISSEEEPSYIVDSCPIILAKQPRSGNAKVAPNLCDKSYNSSRKEWYYGVKLHVFGIKRPSKLPVPSALIVSKASVFDLTAAKQITLNCHPVSGGVLYADKAYIDADWAETLKNKYKTHICTPRKKAKGDPVISGDAVSTFVSSRRQPIESFFNWLQARFHIQSASHIRSAVGLLCHIFSILAAAMFFALFNS
jgi:hypothetical protein